MTTFKVIEGQAALNKEISLVISTGKKFYAKAHGVVVSTLIHVAKHGNPDVLNRLYEGLAEVSVNTQNALRLYVGRIQQLDSPDGKRVPNREVEFLSFAKGKFSVMSGAVEQRKTFETFAETRLLNPDGVYYKLFHQTDNVREQRDQNDILSDLAVMKAAEKIVDSIVKPKKGTTVQITPKTRAIVQRFFDDMKVVADQVALADGVGPVTAKDEAAFLKDMMAIGDEEPVVVPPEARKAGRKETSAEATAH